MVKSYFKSHISFKKKTFCQVLIWVAFLNFFSFTETVLAQGVCTVTLNSGQSISNAISAATAGDTICLDAGTYSGGFTIDKDDITLIGIDSAEKSVITGGGSSLIRIQHSINTRLENLEIQSSANFAINGVGLINTPVEGVVLHNNIISGNNSDEGVLMSYSDNWTFTENVFEDHSIGIRLSGDDHVVSNNTFTDNVLDIEYSGVNNSTITDNLLSNGISFSSSDFNHTITGNTFPNGDVLYFSTSENDPSIPSNARQIIVINATNLEVTGFNLSDSAIPIQVSHSTGAQIYDNEISDLDDNSINPISSGAIRVATSPNALIYDNLLQNNVMTALFVIASDGAIIRDNELQSNLEGIKVRNALNVTVDSNIITNTNNPDRNRGHGVYAASSENLEIINNTISDSDGFGIHDANLTSNINTLIRGNTITGGKSNAIHWTDSREAIIESNIITNNAGGIRGPFDATIRYNTIENSGLGIDSRNNSVVEENEIRNGTTGVSAAFSVEVVDNIITGHEGIGVNLGSSNGQTISNNQMSGNSVDIRFSGNENVTVTDNELETGVILFSFYGEFDEYDHTITGNTVDGKPLVYLKDETNPAIPTNAGQIIVLNSTDVIISDFTFTNVASPVSVLHSPGTQVRNLTIEGSGQTTSQNSALIDIVYSHNSIVENSTLTNGIRGVGINRSEGVTVHNNVIDNPERITSFHGIYTQSSSKTEITDNVINTSGGMRGIEIDGNGNSSVISGNEVSNTINDAVVISFSDSVLVDNNTITNGDIRGIYLSRALDATITNNTITGHGSHGIDSDFNANIADRPYLEGNYIANNSGTGIRLLVNELEMRDNIIEGNEIGAEINEYFVLEDNSFRNNTLEALKISDSVPDSYISQNIIEGNGSGIAFSGSGTLIAGNNWWGAGSGPSGGETDPQTNTVANGSGDSVSSNVNFDPWLSTAPSEPTEPVGETVFEYASFSITSDSIFTGNTAGTIVLVTNTGDSLNYYQADLKLNDQVVQSQSELLGAGQSIWVKMNVQISEPGTYQLSVNDLDTEDVEVVSGWPQKNFGVDNNATADFITGPKTEQLVMDWESVESSTVSSRPVVVDGILYYGMLNNHFYAADANTGEILWETDTGETIRSSAAIKENWVVSGNSNGDVFALNRDDGEYIWNRELGSDIYSSPVIVDDVVYVSIFNDDGESFQALDLNTGSELWVYDIGESSSSTPSVVDGVVYVGSNDGNLYALNASNNTDPEDRLLWIFETPESFGTSYPVVVDDYLYITTRNTLYSIEAETGDLSWSESIPGSSMSNPVISDDLIYIGSSDGTFYALDIDDGEEIWSFEPIIEYVSIFFGNSDPVVADGIVYTINSSNNPFYRTVYGFDSQTGDVLVNYEEAGTITGDPSVINGRVYAGFSGVGIRVFRETVPEDFIADASQSEVTATPLHWADGSDESTIEITVINEFGNPVGGLTSADFEFLGSETISVSSVEEQFSEGEYEANISNTTVENVVLTVEVNGVALQDQPTIEFKSINTNWSAVNIDVLIPDIYVQAVHFENEEEGWILAGIYGDGVRADETQILKTEDGGETWSEQYHSDDFAMYDFFFLDDQKGWTTGFSNIVLHTSDGGETWIEQTVDGIETFQDFTTIHFSDENNGWIAGYDLFYKTENGGETWTVQNLPEFFGTSDIFFTDNETGWAGGQSTPGIVKTVDGGSNWISDADTSSINGLTFIDDQTGFAVGWNGLILKTEDGGSVWELLTSESSENFQSVSFLDENRGWIVGNSGTILSTENGGNTWKIEYPGNSNKDLLQDVHFINPEKGWSIGRSGSVYKYDASTSEPQPIVDASSSSVTTTSPHIADGSDEATVSITLRTSKGQQIGGYESDKFEVTLNDENASAGTVSKTDSSGLYSFTVTSKSEGKIEVTVKVDGITLTDQPVIIFEPEAILDAPELVQISEEESGIVISWSVDSEQFIEYYKVYRGGSVSQLKEFNTVKSGNLTYAETDVPEGTTFYSISAVNNDGVESEHSNIRSYVNENVVANTSWQLSSIPLGSATVASEMATIFGYSNSYITTESLEHSKGYWIKTKTFDTEIIPAVGVGLDSTSVILNKGWNLIGSLSDTISVSVLKDVDEVLTNAPVYSFSNNQYEETKQIIPNSGHWIFASDSGRVDLSIYSVEPDPTKGAEAGKVESKIDDGPKIKFTSGDESSEIIVSNEYLSAEDRYPFMLPPISPDPILDIRTTDHTRLMNNEPTQLELRSVNFPVHVEVEGLEENFEYAYRLTVEKEGEQRAIDLVPGQPNVLSEEYDYISLEKIHVDELITEHKLMPNYPNPFNPTTTIHYQVREQSDVKIEVYDVIGRRVQILADGNQFSGEYRVNFDARNLASGVYLIRFIAGNHMDVQKMTLIK
ncbi:MAG: right-handed parallel beta-helix repeat-containing protein [Balneolaceae bacterium]